MPAPNFRANGTIQPSCFVKLDPAAANNFNVIQAAAATDPVIGISQQGSYDPPGITGAATDAARAGLDLQVYTEGDTCLLKIGAGGCTRGNYLVSDANGNGVADAFGGVFSTSTRFYGAVALETANAGELCAVQVKIGPIPTST